MEAEFPTEEDPDMLNKDSKDLAVRRFCFQLSMSASVMALAVVVGGGGSGGEREGELSLVRKRMKQTEGGKHR